MAIKVNGTTVIDNSRNFTNIAGGFKTVNGTSVVGSGNISAGGGATTTVGAVGQYGFAISRNSFTYEQFPGVTESGSDLRYTEASKQYTNVSSNIPSGTWQLLGYWPSYYNGATLWQRIS